MMYYCACSCYDDVATLFEEVNRKANKEHQCFECLGKIQPGQIYKYASSLYDGAWSHWKTCGTCWRIGQDLCGGCWIPGTMWADLWSVNGLKPNEAPHDNDGWKGWDDSDYV